MMDTLSQEKLKSIIATDIQTSEKLGDRAGESGHLSYVSYQIDQIVPLKQIEFEQKNAWELHFFYHLSIETEFTIYPYNPPHTEYYEKVLILDENGNIIKKEPKKWADGPKNEVSLKDLDESLLK